VADAETRTNHFKESERMTSQRIGKYACLEIERRYLLKKLPDDLLEAANGWLITDRYFPKTRLRLRHMKSVSGNESIYKLTQKYRSETQNAYETTITNLYLTEEEYKQLESLEGKMIKKRRYPYNVQNHNFSIDVFEGRHQGLILAEMEFERQSELGEFALPVFALKDVTDDPFFTGGNLVTMTDEEFKQGLSQRLRDHQSFSQNAT
jgi:CYTH domain-containing protein